MLHAVLAFIPLLFLIIYALKSRKMADAMVLATLLAMVLVHRGRFITGTIEACTPPCQARPISLPSASSSASAA